MIRIFYVVFVLSTLFSSSLCSATHRPQDFLQQIAGSKNEGALIVQHFCANCHAEKPLIPLGAPRIGHDDEWSPRLKKGFSGLLKNTEEGLNAMPAMGGCFECSDKQLKLAILAMLPKKAKDELQGEKDHK